ncbi:putative HTH transcriptional regulator; AraC family [Cupriavidus taiwanensis]|uniref:HTH transcriptional regulator AraC family n=1 Tax=Cupriavidus taiwanensis TaxID=164546 RepID=A0A375ED55_9BURK|nr:helix-turn-helix domain-containing protein [Cupriavidus taiwanensis]SOZ69860.1 putative HTH transcriptional regulator; AraC family [Cupriavidus taiwanensis]SOZ70942.1 putative HTH transcriptional regulator; AraC family [Cupriavidus taiwanensis]SOZ73632.1 putative HTH transcriptional regulator; AraC family [Cupriavidus taiwanensis]SPA10388.1 putative HTH transcriptional regulator; AraC family [Cupriavidus taiwanensis]
MTQLVCPEFDEFEAALYGVQGRYVLRSRPQRDWRLKLIDLNGVAIMMGREGAPTAYSGIGMPNYFNIFIPLSAQQCTIVDGQAFDAQTVGWMAPDLMFHIVAERAASWLTVAISAPLVMHWVHTHADEFDATLLSSNLVCTGRRGVIALLTTIWRIMRVERDDPAQLRYPGAELAARTELVDLVFRAVLTIDEGAASIRQKPRHRQILSRALDLLNLMGETPIFMSDLCAAAEASERSVRNVFHRYLGMGPHRYLALYRMHAIRAALCNAAPGDTVSGICGRFGVWDFGRFAALYSAHFGVLPSQTLRARRASARAWLPQQIPN